MAPLRALGAEGTPERAAAGHPEGLRESKTPEVFLQPLQIYTPSSRFIPSSSTQPGLPCPYRRQGWPQQSRGPHAVLSHVTQTARWLCRKGRIYSWQTFPRRRYFPCYLPMACEHKPHTAGTSANDPITICIELIAGDISLRYSSMSERICP